MPHIIHYGVALAAGAAAYAYGAARREEIRELLLPRVIGRHTVIANCVFDGSVIVRGPLDYCKDNKFNVTGLHITGNPS